MFPIIDWYLISLELLIVAALAVLLIIDIFVPKDVRNDIIGPLSFAALFIIFGFWINQHGVHGTTFGGMFVMDSLAWFFKGFFLVTMFIVFILAQQFFKSYSGEKRNIFYLLLWLALLGMFFVASSADFLVLFIAIEILTISLYVMTAYLKSDSHSIEAGMKYLVLGALSSGFLLYGISLLYGTTHSTRFDAIQLFANTHAMTPMVLFSLVLIFSAVGFKIAAVPFHMWVPDVYQGAPTPVTALLSVGSKAAGFVMLIRLFLSVFAAWHLQWGAVFAVLAAVSMCYGNLVAMFQTNIKRLFGYSSIAHAGYLLMGAAAGTVLGTAAMNFYLVGYLFTNLTAFLVIILTYNFIKSDEINDYAGLVKRSSILGVTLLIALISLAGMPPLAGFFGKFALLMATVQSGYLWLALIAAVNIVISLYYYMMLAKKIYIDPPKHDSTIAVSWPMRLTLVAGIAAIVILGLFQGPFFTACIVAVRGIH